MPSILTRLVMPVVGTNPGSAERPGLAKAPLSPAAESMVSMPLLTAAGRRFKRSTRAADRTG
jgi:hypothetical protein